MILPRWVFRVVWAIDNTVTRLSGGRIAMPNGSRGRLRTLFLRTVGRTSGEPRRNGLYYLEDGPNLVVVASNAGGDRDPAWWRNLQAHPDAEVEVGATRRLIRARQATPAETGPLYDRFVAAIPAYDDYRRKVARPIPVVILEPR
jgi:F420H(2)-dependent quinone reductase